MILADSSVWIDHFRRRDLRLQSLLADDFVLMHDCVIGELACGNLADRTSTLKLLRRLKRAANLRTNELLSFIEQHHLMGSGLGWSDVHLLASAMLNDVQLWTLDKQLVAAAKKLKIHATI